MVTEKRKTTAAFRAERKTPHAAVLMELEYIAVRGRAIVFDVIREVMAAEGMDISPALFSRYCLARLPSEFVGALLRRAGKKEAAGERMSTEVHNRMTEAFLAKRWTLAPGVKDVLALERGGGVAIGIVSGLPVPDMKALTEKLGLTGAVSGQVSYFDEGKGFPPADAWLMLAKAVGMKRTRCLAIASSAHAGKAAVAAHMRCVAVPDEYTAFQDFGGCDCLCESVDAEVIEQLLAAPRHA